MQKFSILPTEMGWSIWRHRELIGILTRRELAARYHGSMLGLLWSFVQPAVMLVIYTVFFSVVMQSRWGMEGETRGDFALVLFAGLIAFNAFSECLNQAPTLLLNNVNYVKKVVFPLEILPVVSLGVALFQAVVSVAAWLCFFVALHGMPHPTALWFPLMLLPLALLILGASWLLAVLGAYFRDISPLVGIITTLFLFFSPIFYSPASLPEGVRFIGYLNPLAPIIENVRRVLCWGMRPDWASFCFSVAMNFAVAWCGFAVFQRARKEFADGI